MIAAGRTTYSEGRTPGYKQIEFEFAKEIFQETAQKIREGQKEIYNDWLKNRSGDLGRSLQDNFSISSTGEKGVKLTMSYLKYARLLDIKSKRRRIKREGYHLYNRIIFGTIYPFTLHNLRFGFTEEVKKMISARLKSAGFIKK